MTRFWLTESNSDVLAYLRSLRNWEPDFGLEVSLAQTQILQKCKNKYWTLAFCNEQSCFFHGHLVHEKAACHKRICDKAHVFIVPIGACVKEYILMANKWGEGFEGNTYQALSVSRRISLDRYQNDS